MKLPRRNLFASLAAMTILGHAPVPVKASPSEVEEIGSVVAFFESGPLERQTETQEKAWEFIKKEVTLPVVFEGAPQNLDVRELSESLRRQFMEAFVFYEAPEGKAPYYAAIRWVTAHHSPPIALFKGSEAGKYDTFETHLQPEAFSYLVQRSLEDDKARELLTILQQPILSPAEMEGMEAKMDDVLFTKEEFDEKMQGLDAIAQKANTVVQKSNNANRKSAGAGLLLVLLLAGGWGIWQRPRSLAEKVSQDQEKQRG